jgi:hypothetical protein
MHSTRSGKLALNGEPQTDIFRSNRTALTLDISFLPGILLLYLCLSVCLAFYAARRRAHGHSIEAVCILGANTSGALLFFNPSQFETLFLSFQLILLAVTFLLIRFKGSTSSISFLFWLTWTLCIGFSLRIPALFVMMLLKFRGIL